MTVDFMAKERHFVDHLAPVWEAFDGRGTFNAVTPEAFQRAQELGIDAVNGVERHAEGRKTLVASIGDLKDARARDRRVALMEHGCGLSYGGDRHGKLNNSYAGGEGRLAEIFLHPGHHPAARDRARYPDARVEVVGSPRLDALPSQDWHTPNEKPVIAVSFHWDCPVAPEARSAFLHYRAYLHTLKEDFTVLGHAHPRIFERLKIWYERNDIEPVRDFTEVCRRADMYAVDNSSTLYEFASTGRPVLVLNAPFYRKDVNHGLRFWDAATVGVQVDDPKELRERALLAIDDTGSQNALREAALDLVYAYRSGAAERASEVLASWT